MYVSKAPPPNPPIMLVRLPPLIPPICWNTQPLIHHYVRKARPLIPPIMLGRLHLPNLPILKPRLGSQPKQVFTVWLQRIFVSESENKSSV